MVLGIVQKLLGPGSEYLLKVRLVMVGQLTVAMTVLQEIKKRKVYIRGKLFVKCAERGLTDPFKGGNVKLKVFMDSLKHACKVPNTDQPYACVDMMVAGVILDKLLGLHQSSVLLTPHQVLNCTDVR